jgi:hypothetical protein
MRLVVPCTLCALAFTAAVARPAFADEPPPARGPISSAFEGTTRTGTRAALTIGGYAEIFYSWNFNNPSNNITALRAFDNRHNTFTISNAVLDAAGALGPVSARIAIQVGQTPETYYQSEPILPGADKVPGSSKEIWKLLQQAWAAYEIPIGRGLVVDAGIFLSPVGPEGIPVKDQWNWSRSCLFTGLPYYHTGIRLTYDFTDQLVLSLQVYNGWNSVVDNNPQKSLAAQLTYTIPERLTFQFLYFTGVERDPGAPEGTPWRHLFDTYLVLSPLSWLSLVLHVDGGVEPNAFGTSGWAAAALYARFHPLRWMYIALRGDFFWERVAQNATGRAAPIFWPVEWVSSATGTLDFRPSDNISLRVEYRHDQAAGDAYFQGQVPIVVGQAVPTARGQDSITIGATTWF